MTFEEAKAKYKEITGEDIDRAVEKSADGYHFGDRVRIIEDDEDHGLYGGDEGFLVLCEVGSPEYGNVRISMSVIVDGYDSPGDDVSYDMIEPVD